MEDVLVQILELFEKHQISYMIAGSFASNIHGTPRTTYDADVVIDTNKESLNAFIAEIEESFYVSEEAALEALARQGMFNIIHLETGFKIDFIFKKSRDYSREEFKRRNQYTFSDNKFWFASPEDVILTKLEWCKQGQSERQFEDALNVAKVQKDSLDLEYIKKWAKEINIIDLVNELIEKIP
jgi:hypothetical protein